MYQITNYTKQRAKELGVTIYPSEHKNKKIDIYKDGEFLFSIGDIRYLDFPSYFKYGKEIAERHRNNYYIRHAKDIERVGSKGWYAAMLLW